MLGAALTEEVDLLSARTPDELIVAREERFLAIGG
jgi:hypothetical protein